MRYFVFAALLLSLVNCAPSGENLTSLRAKAPTGESYHERLAAEYLAYAEALSERGHGYSADKFAVKGLAVFSGTATNLEEDSELEKPRHDLLLVLTDDVKKEVPDKAARAVMLHDCMVNELDWGSSNETLCQESFKQALAELQFIADTLVHGSNNQFIIVFSPQSVKLSNEAGTVLDIVASRIKGLGEYKVELMAYAKRPTASSNVKVLANARLEKITAALVNRGVDEERIHHHSYASQGEVFLNVGDTRNKQNVIGINIQTFGQATEVMAP